MVRRFFCRAHIIAAVFLCCHFQAIDTYCSELDEVISGFDAPDAQEDKAAESALDEVLTGFAEESTDQQPTQHTALSLPVWMTLSGELTLTGSWNFAHDAPAYGEADHRDLSMLRTTAALSTDLKYHSWKVRISGHGFYDAAYSIQGREQYSAQLLDDYEQELEFDEVSLNGSLTGNLDLKTGRQVVVWGKADNVRVTDILNPLDNRIPGLVDIKYRRLPVTMTRLDYYTGNWNINGIVLHEVRFDKQPVFTSDFYPGNAPRPDETIASDFSIDNQQYALALNGIFSGWDLSIYQAWVYDNHAHLEDNDNGQHLIHNRVSMTGLTTNMAWGNWLFKAEGAWWQGLRFAGVPDQDFSRMDMMAGIEYTGFSNTLISLERVSRHLLHFDNRLAQPPDYAEKDQVQTVFMMTRDFINDTLTAKFLWSAFGEQGEDGAFERFQLDYAVNDNHAVSGGVIFYQDGDSYAFSTIEDNDRIFLEYSFAF